MKDGNQNARFDINAKKILRSVRAYYDHKLEKYSNFRNVVRKINRSKKKEKFSQTSLAHMSNLVDRIFPKEVLEIFQIS